MSADTSNKEQVEEDQEPCIDRAVLIDEIKKVLFSVLEYSQSPRHGPK